MPPKPIGSLIAALLLASAPALAQTQEERVRRGVDVLRYCAPQIVALQQASRNSMQEYLTTILAQLGNPMGITYVLRDGASHMGAHPQGEQLSEVLTCMGGRALALDREGAATLGWITFQNRGEEAIHFRPDARAPSCVAPARGLCTIVVQPGVYRIDVLGSRRLKAELRDVRVQAGEQTVVVQATQH